MSHMFVKKTSMYLLIVTLFASSLSFANIDMHLEALDLDSKKTVLRALSNKFKVNWSSEFKLNVPNRRERTIKVLNCLTFILDEKIKKKNNLFIQKRLESENSNFTDKLNQWFSNKTRIYEEIKTKLKGEWDRSNIEDEYAFECLSYPPSEGASTSGTSDYEVVADTIFGQLIRPNLNNEGLVVRQTSMADFPPVLPEELENMFPISSGGPTVPELSSSTALIDLEEDSEELRLQQDVQDREELLSKLDEEGAKIAIHAILNNYLICFNKESDKNRFQDVHAYVNWILQNKMRKVMCKLSSSDVENDEFIRSWYEQKRLEYEGRLEIIWGLFQQVIQSQTN